MIENHLDERETDVGYNYSLESFLDADKSEQQLLSYELIYESNLIEGITTPYIETFSIGPNFEMPLHPELTDHLEALRYVFDNYKKDLTESDIKYIHKTLMQNLLENAGEYRKTKVWVGKNGCPYYASIPKLMRSFEAKISKLNSDDDLWNIHHEFETIHPFIDGNGRTGRLLLNWLSLKYHDEFTVVENSKKQIYYKSIQDFREHFKKEYPSVRFYKDFERDKNRDILNRIVLLIDDDGHLW